MTIFLIGVSAILCYYGVVGNVHTNLPKKIPNLSFVYFGVSATVQLFAMQFFLTSASIFVLSLRLFFPSPWMSGLSGIAALLFLYHLWRSYRGSKILGELFPETAEGLLNRFFKGAFLPLYFSRKNVKRQANIAYGPEPKRNLLDIYTSKKRPSEKMPILIHIHGGAWVIGQKNQQAKPLIHHMTSRGWIVVDINYRLGPKHKFPDMITDVLKAIAWVKFHASEYGGDANFVALTGGSAGGHLTALAALTADYTDFKPGFETADCSVDAAIPVYGIYDFTDRTGELATGQKEFETFMTKYAMPAAPKNDPDIWSAVSPMSHLRAGAPSMLVFHGRHDSLADFKGAEIFVDALSAISMNPVVFAALPTAQHAYDALNSPPTLSHVLAIDSFLHARLEEKRHASPAPKVTQSKPSQTEKVT